MKLTNTLRENQIAPSVGPVILDLHAEGVIDRGSTSAGRSANRPRPPTSALTEQWPLA